MSDAPPAEEPPPLPLELTDGLLHFMRAAGEAEAKKLDDERDFDRGFATACQNAGLPKDFIEENRVELEGAYTDGYEEESERGP